MFDINFYSKNTDFHRYSSDDLALLSIGLGNYTKSSLQEFFNPKKINPDVYEFFGIGIGAQTVSNAIRGLGLEVNMQIMEFDHDEKVYKLKTGLNQIALLSPQKYPPTKYQPIPAGNIDVFLDTWNKIQLGYPEISPNLANSFKVVVDRIHNSLSGCLLFKANFAVLGSARMADIMLVPTYSRDNASSRTMSFKGAPLISAIPQTAEGMQYSFRQTNESAIGAYATPLEGGVNNPKNTVTGNLKLTYDPSTGEFESGTQQILVRLVDDIDAAELSDISGTSLLSAGPNEFYSTEAEGYIGFTKGRGIPLSMENGNPYMYGPNFRGGCTNPTEKSVIIAVNRSNQFFKSGQLVMCSRINNEWLIASNGTSDIKRKITFGNFEYQQYILPANYYFSVSRDPTFGPVDRLLPQDLARKARNYFYLNWTPDDFAPDVIDRTNNIPLLKMLNFFATTIPQDIEDPIKYIKDNFSETIGKQLISLADEECKRDEENAFLPQMAQIGNYLAYPDDNFNEITSALPKNITAKNARSLIIKDSEDENFTPLKSSPVIEEPVYGEEVPYFWGMLFPDGYKSNATAPFIAANAEVFRNNPLFSNDSNLKELSVLSNLGYPDIKFRGHNDEEALIFLYLGTLNFKTYSFAQNYHPDPPEQFDEMRKTTGVFIVPETYQTLFPRVIASRSIYSLHSRYNNYVNNEAGQKIITPNSFIYGLEPVKPGRIQFSSMSIEHLYGKSVLNNASYSAIKTSIDYYKTKFFSNRDWTSINFDLYLTNWWKPIYKAPVAGVENPLDVDFLNIYNIQELATRFFAPNTSVRHSPPISVAQTAGGPILPNVRGFSRSMVAPILNCKSKIRTSADNLIFTTSQLFGMGPKVQVSPADINVPIILPIGGGVAWNQPDAPIKVNSFPQWGDRNRTDNIDSFGTTALHVRVFEGWPIQQTIYLGAYFTPLHYSSTRKFLFGPIQPHRFKHTVERGIDEEDGSPTFQVVPELNDLGKPIPAIDPLDFRVPTARTEAGLGGLPLGVGAIVTDKNLAPFSEWKWNTIRRSVLLTNGGFIYLKKYIGINIASIGLQQNGINYSIGDIFLFPDGTEVEVTELGENRSIKNLKITEGEGEVTFVPSSIQPSYLGSGGSGAIWRNPVFIVKEKYGYDKAPKEVIPVTRLTKPSNNGEELIEGNLSTSLSLNNDTNESKEYDIFYFYHNDPSHYSIDSTLSFNGGWAQYVTVEVNPG